MTPDYWAQAKRSLARSDPTLARIMRRHPGIALKRRGKPFFTLARAIVGQQISVKAADSVWRRFVDTVEAVEPGPVLETSRPALLACGLSRRKAEYIFDLARHFSSGVIDPGSWTLLADEAVIERLTDVRGIGRWTAEMFLIFNMLRPNVLPLDDLGLQRAIRLNYFSGRKTSAAAIKRLARNWEPWRSVATWYLWRSLDPVPVEY